MFQALKRKEAFTFLELMIAIAIIGILSTIILISFGSGKEKARDAKRQADIQQIGAALELYYSDNNGYLVSGVMPGSISNYFDPIPLDPQSSAAYEWVANDTPPDNQRFCAYAVMEQRGSCPTVRYFAVSHKGSRDNICDIAPSTLDCW